MSRWIALSSLFVACAALAQAPAPAPTPAPTPPPAPAAADAGPAPVVAPPEVPPGPRTFTVDPKQSQFVIQVFKDGAAAAFAHDHTVHAVDVVGEVVADAANPAASKVNITVQTKSLVNDDPQMRKQFGLDPSVPEKDRISVNDSMKAEEQLWVSKYPTITFTSTSVEKTGEGKITLVGDFTLRGQTKKLKLPVTVKIDGNNLKADGKVRFKTSDWGMKPYSAFLGAVKNKDEVVLNVHLVGTAK